VKKFNTALQRNLWVILGFKETSSLAQEQSGQRPFSPLPLAIDPTFCEADAEATEQKGLLDHDSFWVSENTTKTKNIFLKPARKLVK